MKVIDIKTSTKCCKHHFEVNVISADFLEQVLESKEDKVLVLDMANPSVKGGFNKFDTRIAIGQEEYLIKHSNLSEGLDKVNYPLNCNESFPLITSVKFYHPNNCLVSKECDVAVCAAPMHSLLNFVNGRDSLTDFEIRSLRIRIRTLLTIAKDYDVAIFSALGCGAFRCPPEDVSKVFKEEIEKSRNYASEQTLEDSTKKTKIKFVIKTENYVKDNYNVFKNTLEKN
jgi:uncharacterized protein (TIGR02452 family)